MYRKTNMQVRNRETKNKQETDRLIIKLHDALSNDMKTETEKIALSKVLLSKQQENNEKLINEQAKIIESLNHKCKKLESDLNKPNQASNGRKYFKNSFIILGFSLPCKGRTLFGSDS